MAFIVRRAPWSILATLANGIDPTGPLTDPQTWVVGSLSAPLLPGDRMLGIAHAETGTASGWIISAINDSLGTVWTKDLIQTFTSSTAGEEVSIWSALVTTPGTPSNITLTIQNGPGGGHDVGVALSVIAVRGLSAAVGAAGIDVSRFINNTAASGVTADTGTSAGTTTQPNLLKVGFFSTNNHCLIVPGTVDAAYTFAVKQDGGAVAYVQGIEWASSGPLGSTARAQLTQDSGSDYAMGVIVYK